MNFVSQIGYSNFQESDPFGTSKLNNYIKENLLISNNQGANNFYHNMAQNYASINNEQEEIFKTLILDLDETLIHSTPLPMYRSDGVLNIFSDGQQCNVYIKKRPGLDSFLKRMALFYNLAVFTASEKNYADEVIEYIDSNHLISNRFYRENCSITFSGVVKDLTQLNIDLKDIILLDNTPSTYSLQPANGIPIPSWTGSSMDDNLKKIGQILELLSKVDDVRKYIPKFIKRNTIMFQKAISILGSEANEMTPKRLVKNSVENRASNNQIKRKLFYEKSNSKQYSIDRKLKNSIKANAYPKMSKQGMTPLRKLGESYSISLDPDMNINQGKYIRRNNTNSNYSKLNKNESIMKGNNDQGSRQPRKVTNERKKVESKIKNQGSLNPHQNNRNNYQIRKYIPESNPINNSLNKNPYQYQATKLGNEAYGNFLNSNEYLNLYAKISTSNFGHHKQEFE